MDGLANILLQRWANQIDVLDSAVEQLLNSPVSAAQNAEALEHLLAARGHAFQSLMMAGAPARMAAAQPPEESPQEQPSEQQPEKDQDAEDG